MTDFPGRESTARFDLVVRVDDVPGLGMRSLNFAKKEATEDASALPATSGIDTPCVQYDSISATFYLRSKL